MLPSVCLSYRRWPGAISPSTELYGDRVEKFTWLPVGSLAVEMRGIGRARAEIRDRKHFDTPNVSAQLPTLVVVTLSRIALPRKSCDRVSVMPEAVTRTGFSRWIARALADVSPFGLTKRKISCFH